MSPAVPIVWEIPGQIKGDWGRGGVGLAFFVALKRSRKGIMGKRRGRVGGDMVMAGARGVVKKGSSRDKHQEFIHHGQVKSEKTPS